MSDVGQLLIAYKELLLRHEALVAALEHNRHQAASMVASAGGLICQTSPAAALPPAPVAAPFQIGLQQHLSLNLGMKSASDEVNDRMPPAPPVNVLGDVSSAVTSPPGQLQVANPSASSSLIAVQGQLDVAVGQDSVSQKVQADVSHLQQSQPLLQVETDVARDSRADLHVQVPVQPGQLLESEHIGQDGSNSNSQAVDDKAHVVLSTSATQSLTPHHSNNMLQAQQDRSPNLQVSKSWYEEATTQQHCEQLLEDAPLSMGISQEHHELVQTQVDDGNAGLKSGAAAIDDPAVLPIMPTDVGHYDYFSQPDNQDDPFGLFHQAAPALDKPLQEAEGSLLD